MTVAQNPYRGAFEEADYLRLAHQDERRIIYEHGGNDFSVQRFHILKRCILGNHFHLKKTEVFTLLRGGGTVFISEPDRPGVTKCLSWPIIEGFVIRVKLGVAHAFRLDAGSELHCYSSAPFDASDVHPKELVK